MEHVTIGSQLLNLLFLVIFVEAVVEIITTSTLFQRARDFVSQRSLFLAELVNCGYCISVWIAASISWIAPISLSSSHWINYFLTLFIVHRSSNVFHELLSKWFNRRPIQLAVYKTENITLKDERENQDESHEN